MEIQFPPFLFGRRSLLPLAIALLVACTDPGRIVLMQLPDDAYGSGPPVAFQQRVAIRAAQRSVDAAVRDAMTMRNPNAAVGSDQEAGATHAATAPAALVDLNHASIQQLTSLPRVGPAMAERIVAARPFQRTSQLQRVRGIGDATWRQLRDRVCVNCAAPVAPP